MGLRKRVALAKSMPVMAACLASFCLANAAGAQVTTPESTLRLAPSTPWNVDFAENSCAARRAFGEEGQQVFLSLRQYAPDGDLQMVVSSADFRRRGNPRLQTTFLPDSARDEADENAMGITVEGFGEGFITSVSFMSHEQQAIAAAAFDRGVPGPIDEMQRRERLGQIEGLLVEGGFRSPLMLVTGPLVALEDAMRRCGDHLVTHWGLDAEQQRNRTRPVMPIAQESWARILQQRYPTAQLRRGDQAHVRIRMMISETGQPTDCLVQSDINDAAFDTLACRLLMANAQFEPALDAAGAPISSYWTTAVVYRIG